MSPAKGKDRSLRALNVKRWLLTLFRLVALALFLYAGWFLSLRQYENGIAVAAVGLLAVLLTVLPAKKIYREQWYLDKARVSLGAYAEEVGLERRVTMDPDYFRMLCLFPTGGDDDAFRFSNRITARCRGRKLQLTDATVPLPGGDLLNGCLIQLDMPRAPLSRFRMVGETICDEETLTAFFRRQHKLLRAEAPFIPDMAVYSDQPLSPQEQDRLNALLQGEGEDMAAAIEGRTLYCFIAGKSGLVPPRRLPAPIRREMLAPLTIRQIPAFLDYAFDTRDLKSNADAFDYDEREDIKRAGVPGEVIRSARKEDKPAPPKEPEPEKLPEGALETKRLILRKLTLQDAGQIYTAWASDPEVTRYLPWNPHESVEVTRRQVDQWVRGYQDPLALRYGVTLKDSGELIGTIGIAAWPGGQPELEYVLGRPWWNRGYMTEACARVTEELFKRNCASVFIQAHADNAPGNLVAQNCGYTYIGTQQKQFSPQKPWPVAVHWYRADRADWRFPPSLRENEAHA